MKADEPRWPWVGPRPYAADQRQKFRGREEDLQRIITAVEGLRFVWLTAASAVGKTSLIQAGLVPELYLRRFRELLHIRNAAPASPPEKSQGESADDVLRLGRGFPLLVRQWGRRRPNDTFDGLLRAELREALSAGADWHDKRITLIDGALHDKKRKLAVDSLRQLDDKLRAHRDQRDALGRALKVVDDEEGTSLLHEDGSKTLGEIVDTVRTSSANMVTGVTEELGNIVIIYDQFEEILSDPRLGPQATATIEEIFVRHKSTVRQMVSMREDSRHLMKPLEDAKVATGQRLRDLPPLTRNKVTKAFTLLAEEYEVVKPDGAERETLAWLIKCFSPTVQGVRATSRDKDMAPVDLLGLQAFLYSQYEEAMATSRDPLLSDDTLPELARAARKEHPDGDDVSGLADDYLKDWIDEHLARPGEAGRGRDWEEVILLSWDRVRGASSYLFTTDGQEFTVDQAACALPVSEFSKSSVCQYAVTALDAGGTPVSDASRLQVSLGRASKATGSHKPSVEDATGFLADAKAELIPALDEMVKRVAAGFQRWLVTPNFTKRPAPLHDLVEEAVPVELRRDATEGFSTAGRAAKEGWSPDQTLAMVYATCRLALDRLEAGWVLKQGSSDKKITYELVHDGYAAPYLKWADAEKLLPDYFIGSVTPEISTDIRWTAGDNAGGDGPMKPESVEDMSYANLVWQSCLVTGAHLEGVSFADCRFERTLFRECWFGFSEQEASFVGGSLRNATFEDCHFENFRFGRGKNDDYVDTDMEGVVFRSSGEEAGSSADRTSLTRVSFCDIRMKSAEIRDCNLSGCEFVTRWIPPDGGRQAVDKPDLESPVSLWNMLIFRGSLKDVTFRGSDDNGSVCLWRSGSIQQAEIVGRLTFSRVSLVTWSLEQPKGVGKWCLSIEDCDLTAAVFIEANLMREAGHALGKDAWVAKIARTGLRGAAFLGSELDGVLFSGRRADGLKTTGESLFFRESPLAGSKNTTLGRVKFEDYDAPGLVMRRCNVRGAVKFSNCNLHRAGFIDVRNDGGGEIDLWHSDISTAQILLAEGKKSETEADAFSIQPRNRNTIDVFLFNDWPKTGGPTT